MASEFVARLSPGSPCLTRIQARRENSPVNERVVRLTTRGVPYRRFFGRGQASPLFPLARTKAPREGLAWVSPSLDQRDKGLEVVKTLLDRLRDVIDDLRDSLVK